MALESEQKQKASSTVNLLYSIIIIVVVILLHDMVRRTCVRGYPRLLLVCCVWKAPNLRISFLRCEITDRRGVRVVRPLARARLRPRPRAGSWPWAPRSPAPSGCPSSCGSCRQKTSGDLKENGDSFLLSYGVEKIKSRTGELL